MLSHCYWLPPPGPRCCRRRFPEQRLHIGLLLALHAAAEGGPSNPHGICAMPAWKIRPWPRCLLS
jgi:hypothetical protein